MARAGLGTGWQCLFANDFDSKKGRVYAKNWGNTVLKLADIRTLDTSDIPHGADLAWASFPCQDLSLAGGGAGLRGERSGTFWPFMELMRKLASENRQPRLIGLENVCGTLTSHGGRDFSAICDTVSQLGYAVGALVIDAVEFLPHSRPRLFIVCCDRRIEIPRVLQLTSPEPPWHPKSLRKAYDRLSPQSQDSWVWWRLPAPEKRSLGLADLLETDPKDVKWFTEEETTRLIGMMSPTNQDKLASARSTGKQRVGMVYRRTRSSSEGIRVQRAEIRFDDVSGCLRTPAGGSSRQVVVIVEGSSVRARLISARETARLMGLPDSYILPERYNEAYHVTGDGVVVPVVRHLATNLFEPLLNCSNFRINVAA